MKAILLPFVSLLGVLAVLGGCGRPAAPGPMAELEWYPLLTPAALGQTVAVEQLVEGSFRDRAIELHAQLEVDSDALVLLAFTPYRSRAFMIRLVDTTLSFENYTDRELPFAPEMIISDIQLIFWPTVPENGPWRIEDRPHEKQRLVYHDGQVWCRIQYEDGFPLARQVKLENLRYNYHLTVRTLNPWGEP